MLRKSRLVGTKSYKNSAEHSWHVCLSTLMLKKEADEAINFDQFIRMPPIHDLGGIDADDKLYMKVKSPIRRRPKLIEFGTSLPFATGATK